MNSRYVRNAGGWFPCVLLALVLVGSMATAAQAQDALPPVTIGAGMQTSLLFNSPDGGSSTTSINLNSARIYIGGPITGKVKFMFNTEYNPGSNDIGILDAAARFEPRPEFNIWMGRFLPPSDRANLYGPYYSHHWAVYTDGIQDGYPFLAVGRDNGIAYWGQFGKVKASAGIFDGASTTGNPDVLTAARVQVNLWDAEDGYYLNGTYYGGKNLLSLGAAVQGQDGNTAATFDFLLERKLAGGAAFTVESQYANYDGLGGYDGNYVASSGAYVLAAYLFGPPVGNGKIEFLIKYAKANFTKGLPIFDPDTQTVVGINPDYDQSTTEFNLNYLFKEFNGRAMFFIKKTTFTDVKTNTTQAGVGLQIQM